MTTTKRCVSCNLRPQMTRSNPNFSHGTESCEPCDTLGGWENAHSDAGHDDIDSYTVENTTFKTKAEVKAYIAETKREMESCWVCHPELDQTRKDYTPRTGTSRKGMKLNVTRSQSAKEKAALVTMAIEGKGNGSVKVYTRKGVTTLTGKIGDEITVKVVWDGARFSTGQINGRKVRNVSETLKLIAV
jgi:hypothetical protein